MKIKEKETQRYENTNGKENKNEGKEKKIAIKLKTLY